MKGSEEEILEALSRYGLDHDGEIIRQSARLERYQAHLESLRRIGALFDCGCSRADLARAASAPAAGDPVDTDGLIYPGTCRNGLPPGRAPRAVRFRAGDRAICFDDLVMGRRCETLTKSTGDFVVKRADGVFAYQLAVVVDDAEQGVTQVVRGGDLLWSTPRQIALQRALGFPTPQYAHLPLILGPSGAKLGKREGSLPLPLLDEAKVTATLGKALEILGQKVSTRREARLMLDEAVRHFDVASIPTTPIVVESM